MYDPVKDGMQKTPGQVVYYETSPPPALCEYVHSYWQIKTLEPLDNDFTLHAIPDACVNILFNQKDPDIAGITALKTTYTELNLGRDFDYSGIQLFPGVWRGEGDMHDSFVGSAYTGKLPLKEVNQQSAAMAFAEKHRLFGDLVFQLIEQGVVQRNPVTQKLLAQLSSIHSVADMAKVTHLSTRQLQRVLKQSTGFSPHDFLKVVRLQQSLKEQSHNQQGFDRYTDQSHFIRSFKKITGYTPSEYYQKYDV